MRKAIAIGFVSLAVWLSLPLLSPQWSTVYDTWSGGESTSSLTVWGWTMLTLGRVGKVAQFAAGLAVALDLVDPKKLRDRGRAARQRLVNLNERTRRRRRARRLHRDADRLFGWLVRVEGRTRLVGTRTVSTVEYVLRPEAELRPRLPGFDESQLRRLARRVRSRLSPEPLPLRDEQSAQVRAEIASFIRHEHPDDAAQLDSHVAATSRLRLIWAVVSALVVAALIVIVVVWAHGPSDPTANAVSPTTMVVVLVLGIPVIFLFAPRGLVTGNPSTTVAVLQRLAGLPWIAFLTVTARVLDKARPGHVLRWLGFFLFLHGFALDLLAS